MKKYLSQNRFVFHRSSDLYKKTNSIFVNYREILKKLRGVNSVLYTELTPRSFSNISRLFTNIQFLFLHKSKLWWKMHLFCERHFLIRSIVWPLFWYELSPENYDFLVLVITIKLSTWSKNIFHKKDASFIVVSIHVKKKLVSLWTTERYPITEFYRIYPTNIFSNISRLFTNIQFVSLYKSKLRWRTHLFCKRHFLIRLAVWSLSWYKLSPENYDLSAFLIRKDSVFIFFLQK